MKKIFSLTLLSFFVLSLLGVNYALAQTATLFSTTPLKEITKGERFMVDVRVKSPNESINAVTGSISYPTSLVNLVSISKSGSIINFWTQDPKDKGGVIGFEGVVLNPGFQGSSGLIIRLSFEAKATGVVPLKFLDGSILANDGMGSNVLVSFQESRITIKEKGNAGAPIAVEIGEDRLAALPVITDYSSEVTTDGQMYIKGKGEPYALTKLVFKPVGDPSIGERFIRMLQTKRQSLDDVLVQNDEEGNFEYVGPKGPLAGIYNTTPFLVDAKANVEKPGLGKQILISDNKIVRILIVVINVLALLVPVVGLIMLIYFIPWYSWKRMRLLRKQIGIEEEKLELSSHQLARKDKQEEQQLQNPSSHP